MTDAPRPGTGDADTPRPEVGGTHTVRPDALGIAHLVDGNTPTPEQIRVIEADPTRPVLVVAGAGSGKTETMSMRVLWLVAHEGMDPESILGLTFTRKAAAELGSRLRARLGSLADSLPGLAEAGDPVSLTYNSFAERIVSEHGLRIGVDPDFRMLGQAGAVQMMTDIVESWRGDLPGDAAPSTVVHRSLALAGHVAEHDLTLDQAREELTWFGTSLREIGKPTSHLAGAIAANDMRLALLDLVAEFDRRKRAAGFLDFSDQLSLATRIVTEAPDVCETLRRDHRAVLLDEFQDTSVVQMELLSRVFHDHPVTAVGDPNQAIYGWRGASAASLEGFLSRFQPTGEPDPDQTLSLSTSWRNDRQVLDVANKVAEPLRAHSVHAVSPVLRARDKAGEGSVEVAYTLDRGEQVEVVADFIQAHRVPLGSRMASAAVLCRRRRDFQAVDDALRARDIPTQVIGLGGLLDQPAVADLRAALELGVDVTNSPWVVRLLANLDLGSADLRVMGEWSRKLARRGSEVERPETLLLDAVDFPPEPGWSPHPGVPAFTEAAARRVRVLGRRLRAVRRGGGRGVVEQVERAISIMGLAEDVTADPLLNTGRESLDAFVDVATDFEASAQGATMRGFLTWLSVAEEEESGLAGPSVEPDPAAVQIMTIHGAKGLEWDAVAVFAMDDGIFPKHSGRGGRTWQEEPQPSKGWLGTVDELPYPVRRDADSLPAFLPDLSEGRTPQAAFNKWVGGAYAQEMGAHMEREERRLAYVALTRARRDLLMTGSWIDHAKSLRPPSRYLMEPLMAGLTRSDPAWAVAPRPDEETTAALVGATEPAEFPRRPGRSRELVSASALRVAARALEMEDLGLTTDQVLDSLEEEPLARDVRALLEERALREESRSVVVTPERLPATSVSRLLEDPQAFALDLRRPLPAEPSEASALGTIFHAWAERQLRQTSGELWDEPVPGEETLSERERTRLAAMQEHFRGLSLLATHVPVGIEEPFAVEIAGVSVQGRIDAVFRDAGGRDTVVDWKSGRVPSEVTEPAVLRYYLTQLRLYRLAWARRTGVPEEQVAARVAFLAGPTEFSLEDLVGMLGDGNGGVLDDAVGVALRRA